MFDGKTKDLIPKINDFVKLLDERIKKVDERITKVNELLEEKTIGITKDMESYFDQMNRKAETLSNDLNKKLQSEAKATDNMFNLLENRVNTLTERLKEVTGTKLETITADMANISKDVTYAKTMIVTVKQDLEEIAAVNKSIAVIKERIGNLEGDRSAHESKFQQIDLNYKQSITELTTKVNEFNDFKLKMDKTVDELREFMRAEIEKLDTNYTTKIKCELERMSTMYENEMRLLREDYKNAKGTVEDYGKALDEKKQVLITKNDEVEQCTIKIKQLEAVLDEKSSSVDRLERNLDEARKQSGKLEPIEAELKKVREERNRSQARLNELEKELMRIKTAGEPMMLQNAHIRTVLQQTEQGRILLLLQKAAPQPMTIEELSDKLGIAAVMVKAAVNAMLEMKIVRFNREKREVTLI